MPAQPPAPTPDTNPGRGPLPSLYLPVASRSEEAVVPALLTRARRRGAGGGVESLVPSLRVVRRWVLAAPIRGETPASTESLPPDQRLLALEGPDGCTVFMRADALAEQLQRSRPELIRADGSVDFASLGARDAASRGLGDWVWKQVCHLVLERDAITDLALEKASDLLGERVEDLAVAGLSTRGAKALMAAIEEQLAGEPGLYPWTGGPLDAAARCRNDLDPRLAPLAQGQPALVFIHGTGSHTLGGFGELTGSTSWPLLQRQFEGRIFGYEHRTFSESPIDNALALVDLLPAGARICLVTHSRGGLVGDLLCLATDAAADGAGFDALVSAYRRSPRPDEREAEQQDALRAQRREAHANEEQAKLRALAVRLRDKRLKVERYVRVAAPARGTALLSDSLDVFLSGLLTVVRKVGAWGVGAVAGALASPLAGQAAQVVAERSLELLARVVLEIADKRLQPQVVPGIEAMLPESPLGMLLARAQRRSEVAMAVIAGDIESRNAGLLMRIGVMFTDWMLFDRAAHDLVVDTASMYGGLAERPGARAIFVQGGSVNHFRYFSDETRSAGTPLPQALQHWLCADAPALLDAAPWGALEAERQVEREKAPPPSRHRSADGPLPRLVIVPGIMGSHLQARRDRIWLDPADLALGGLSPIAMNAPGPVSADGLVELAYGALADHLGASHAVTRFDYDWRQPVRLLGRQLAATLREQLQREPARPLRLLVHSMGGLVTRAAFLADPALWDDLVASGGRLVMMGTPNHGSHLFVETLLGRSATIRLLARADLRDSMQEVLDIVAGFPGALDLLPAPGFIDSSGRPGLDYHDPATWQQLKSVHHDFWFGRQLCGVPATDPLKRAGESWRALADTAWVQRHPERVAYVFGQAGQTPCGLRLQRGSGVLVLNTTRGDGSVTWASGRLPGLPEERCWFMPVDHLGLTSSPRYFGEVEALLLHGTPLRLGRLPASRGADDEAVTERGSSPPPAYPGRDELVGRLLGATPAPRLPPCSQRPGLKVRVRAMDVRFAQVPVLCGHYRGDPIAGAQALIDRDLVDGALRRRAQLGLHAGEAGSAAVVLMPRSPAEVRQGLGRGALVVGLGEMGRLSAERVAEAVRAGVLRYLMHADDRAVEEAAHGVATASGAASATPRPLRLASLLIGANSAAQLSIEESVRAVVLGVLRANAEFADGLRQAEGAGRRRPDPVQVGELDLIELYRDAAITAAHAVARLPDSLADELRPLAARLEVAQELLSSDSARERLSLQPGSDYWPRLQISDADREEGDCGGECYDIRLRHSIPPDALRQILTLYGRPEDALALRSRLPLPTGLDLQPLVRHAERFRFVHMGERAHAPVLVRQRQPGLVEQLVAQAVSGPDATADDGQHRIGNTLFQLLLPLELKATLRQANNLILVVDEASANLPWEMLAADGEPLALRTRLVRQLLSARFRREPRSSDPMTACVIANPSTAGFQAQFGGPEGRPAPGQVDRLVSLDGAQDEGELVAQTLQRAGYDVLQTRPDAGAAEVFTALFARAHRVLVIAAHGIHGLRAADGSWRSGVVLSDGLVLSAAEIGLMERVPDIVFLSCCHLGKVGSGAGASHRLAYSLARELIEMGVRCVVAAGWAVDDLAAQSFSTHFFAQMVDAGAPFADAVLAARRQARHECPHRNTWGAYQAYGDPQFRLRAGAPGTSSPTTLRAPEELLQWLEGLRLDAHRHAGAGTPAEDAAQLQRRQAQVMQRLAALPPAWSERPEILHAQGLLWAEFGEAGFGPACELLQRAIAAHATWGEVPLRAVEQLANFEARSASALLRSGDATGALARVQRAVMRLELLLTLACDDPAARPAANSAATAATTAATTAAGNRPGNAERLALLGSARKRKAEILLMLPDQGWQQIEPELRAARDAYLDAEQAAGTGGGGGSYAVLNRLQLDALLGEPVEARLDLIDQAQAAAAERFAQRLDPWDALARGDGEVTRWLFGTGAAPAGSLERLVAAYDDVVGKVLVTGRVLDSVLQQHRLMAAFLRVRSRSGDKSRARLLERLAQQLSNVASRG